MGDAPTGVTAVVAPVAATAVMRQPTEATRVVAPPPDEEPPPGPRRWPVWVAALLVLALVGVAGAFLLRGGDGRATVTVPDLQGQQVGDAVRELQALGLGTSRVDVADSGQEPNTVVGTDPAAGTDVEEGSTVTLRVAAGPDTLTVPDVRNEPIDDARRTLTTAGFEVAVTRAQSETVGEDLVISQDPGAGADAAAGSTVRLRVSSGAGTVEVPDVTNQDRASAASELEGAGLVVGSVTNQPDDRLEPGTVISQDPSAGSEVDRGSSVNLVVAIEPADVTVPDVVGSDAGTANSELSAAGLVPLSEGTASEQPEGTVLSQSPGGGASARPGSTVRITVSLGPTKDEGPAAPDPPDTPETPPATDPATTTDGDTGEPLP
jgi:serine/threonine-protein kinase